MTNKPSYLYWPALLTVMAFFSLGLVAHKVVNFCFYLLILIFITLMLIKRHSFSSFLIVCKKYWPIHLAMFGTVIAIFINLLSTQTYKPRLFDYPSRIAIFVFIFWMMLQIPKKKINWIKWAWIAGVILCTIQLQQMPKDADGRPAMLVWYIELVMLLGLFAVLSIGWNNPNNKPALLLQTSLQILAGLCGLYSVYISETRGIWIAIPVFLLLISMTFIKNWASRKNLLILTFFTLAMGVAFSNTEIVSKRIQEAKENIHLYATQENTDTPIGVRLQLWKGSWLLFTEHPVFGVGREHYYDAMNDLVERKIITPKAATFSHSHNEILYNLMTLGIVGLIGLLLVYLVPTYYFAREMRNADREIRASAAMGLCLCFGYMIYGLVDVMLKYNSPANFYSFAAAVFLAQIIKRKEEILSAASHTIT